MLELIFCIRMLAVQLEAKPCIKLNFEGKSVLRFCSSMLSHLAVVCFFFHVPTGSDISDFIHNLESQDIKVEMMKHSDYMAAAPHSAAINVTGSSKVTLILDGLGLLFDSIYLMKLEIRRRMWSSVALPPAVNVVVFQMKSPLFEGCRVLQLRALYLGGG